jgi:VIT1/CCC1 family predicted Fe2+/Mn2+ transporter
VVFGSIDGVFSVLGIIAAGASAALTSLQIFATGLGGAAAGALSVFAAMYLSQTTEKKTRLLAAWENSRKIVARKARNTNNGGPQLREPTKKEHKMFHEVLAKIHRRALLSGLVVSTTSTLASLALLVPLVMLSPRYGSTTATDISILTGIFLVALMGAFRGVTLKQSAAKSAIKMVILGIVIIIASRILGSYVQTLLK